jgi:hypothetical protein
VAHLGLALIKTLLSRTDLPPAYGHSLQENLRFYEAQGPWPDAIHR